MKELRIALIVNTFPKLSETFIFQKVDQLIKSGHKVHIYCSNLDAQFLHNLFPDLHSLSITVFSKSNMLRYVALNPFKILITKKKELGFSKALYDFYRMQSINAFHPDIIHFEFSPLALDYMPYLEILKGSKIVSCRGSAEKVKLLQYPERQKMYQRLFSVIDGIHCVSQDMKNNISYYCNDTSKIFVCYSGIDTNKFCKNPYSRHSLEASLKIVSVGRMTFAKGFANGLLVMKILKDRGLHFNWRIIGTDKNEEELVFKINQLGLQQEVQIVGELTHEGVKNEITNADIFFLSSVYEGMANVVLEAMSMGIPVVSTKCGGMNEAIQHQYDGMLASIYNFEEQANCILEIANDPAIAEKLGANARKKVLEKFEIQKQSQQLIAWYKSLVLNNKDC